MSVGDPHAELERHTTPCARQDRIAELEAALRDLLEVSFPGFGADPDTEKYLRQKYDEATERAKTLLGIKD